MQNQEGTLAAPAAKNAKAPSSLGSEKGVAWREVSALLPVRGMTTKRTMAPFADVPVPNVLRLKGAPLRCKENGLRQVVGIWPG